MIQIDRKVKSGIMGNYYTLSSLIAGNSLELTILQHKIEIYLSVKVKK